MIYYCLVSVTMKLLVALILVSTYIIKKTNAECPNPPPSVDGYLIATPSGYTEGSTAGVSCAVGYVGSPTSSTIICEATNSWSTPSGCTIRDCGNTLPTPTNGATTLDVDGATTYGSTATQSCNAGYSASGTTQLSCLDSGQWQTVTLTCTIKDCGNTLPMPTNGATALDVDGVTLFGSTATQFCDVGYSASGTTQLSCLESGQWQTVTLTCTIKDCGNTLPTPTNGATTLDVDGVTTFGATATQSCNMGYRASGTTQLSCLETGHWQTVTLTCTIKDCGDTTPIPTNGVTALDVDGATTFGSTATQSCNAGYSASGTTQLSCLETGQWQTVTLTCTIKDCGNTLPMPTNGATALDVDGVTTFGSTATQSCKAGYSASGTTQLSCLESGQWQTVTLTCTIKGCQFGKFGHGCFETCPCVLSNTQSCDAETGACTCKGGWTGDSCSLDINECSSDEVHGCPPGSICTNTIGSYFCQCDTTDTCQGLTVALGTVSGVLGAVILTLIAAIIALIFKLKNRGNEIKRDNPNYELPTVSANQRDNDTYDSLDPAIRAGQRFGSNIK